ncbi:MAG: hypothetical protein KAT37_02850 [Candidatus Aenigmarchaeota archaeon]|nr:hypothetical protein [Candidatus Aenigmarchaeota archaeon]
MKLNLSGLFRGYIGLKDSVIDLNRLEKRPRITNEDVERYYDECLDNLDKISNDFSDKKVLKEIGKEYMEDKRPEFIARDPVYPRIFSRKIHDDLDFFDSSPAEEDKYFHSAKGISSILLDKNSPYLKIYDKTKRKAKGTVYGHEAIIIPNDRTHVETKGRVYHETTHMILKDYLIRTNRLLTKDEENVSKHERYVVEMKFQEAVVNNLTDIMLEDDKEALFESRWIDYIVDRPGINRIALTAAAISTGLVTGISFFRPALVLMIPVPVIITRFAYDYYKEYKREELIKPVIRKNFMI